MTRSPFFSRKSRQDTFRIRPAVNADAPAVEYLLHDARLRHVALEWWTVQECLDSPTSLVLTDGRDHPVGLAFAFADDGPVAWLRVVAADSDRFLPAMLEASLQVVQAQGTNGLAALGAKDWLLSQLEPLGFRQVNQVVILCQAHPWRFYAGPPEIRVRAVTSDDLAAIVALERLAFEPLWWYSLQTLQRGLEMACCSHIAFLGGVCVGYQFSTVRAGRGHLVRLAVHPDWQGQGIGKRLLGEALAALRRAGADEITVNTQENNQAALKLYRYFGFDTTGGSWSVWLRTLESL